MEVFAEVLYFITLALFYALSGNHNFTIPTSFRLLWHMLITLKTGGLSFVVLHTVLATASRGRTICSAKKPARLQAADTWPGQSPTCEPTDMIYRPKNIQMCFEEMAWNTRLLVSGLSCKELNIFLVNEGLLGTNPKSLESMGVLPVEQQALPNGKLLDYDKEAWLWKGCRSTVGPGPPRLRGDYFIGWSCQNTSGLKEQFMISPEDHYSKVFNTFDSLPCTCCFDLLHIAPCQPCQRLQNQAYFLG